MLRICFILVALSFSTTLYAQEALAKLRYQEAEEAFNAGNFSLTLKKLDEVVGILKDENPRTLYLRIQAQKAMLPADPCQNEEVAIQLMNSCKLYVSRYEKVEALQDNAIDVYKIMDASGVTPTTAAERTAYEEIKKQWASLDYTSLRKLYEAHTAAYNSCFTRNAARELTLLKKLSEKNNAIITAGGQASVNLLLDYLNLELECKQYFGKAEYTNNYNNIYSSLTKNEENILQHSANGKLILIPVDEFTYGAQKLKIMQQGFNDYPDYSTLEIIDNFSTLCPSGLRVPYEAELKAYFESLPDDRKKAKFFNASVPSSLAGRTYRTSPLFIARPSNDIIDDLCLIYFSFSTNNKPGSKDYLGWATIVQYQLSYAKTRSQIKSPSDLKKHTATVQYMDNTFFKISDETKRPSCLCVLEESSN